MSERIEITVKIERVLKPNDDEILVVTVPKDTDETDLVPFRKAIEHALGDGASYLVIQKGFDLTTISKEDFTRMVSGVNDERTARNVGT